MTKILTAATAALLLASCSNAPAIKWLECTIDQKSPRHDTKETFIFDEKSKETFKYDEFHEALVPFAQSKEVSRALEMHPANTYKQTITNSGILKTEVILKTEAIGWVENSLSHIVGKKYDTFSTKMNVDLQSLKANLTEKRGRSDTLLNPTPEVTSFELLQGTCEYIEPLTTEIYREPKQ